MAIKTILLAVFILALTFKPSLANSLIECPKDPSGDILAADVTVKKDGYPFFSQTERVRIPESGVFESLITCIMATDKSGTGKEVITLNGGVSYSFVELQFTSKMNEGLDYETLVYRAP